jgi:hypothetical protein
MAPTYPIGGSDFSYTRQGGIHILLLKLVAIVFALLGGNVREKREYRIPGSAASDFFIDSNRHFSFKTGPSGLSPAPKVLSKL